MQSVIRIGFFLVFGLLTTVVRAQETPYLEKQVNLKAGTYTYEELFRQLSNQTGVVFSYTTFDDKRKTTVKSVKEPLRMVLNVIFNDGSCTYKTKGKYVIITCKAPPKPKPDNSVASNSNVIVNGYVYDAEDSSQVSESSVYLRQNKQSAVTNEYGYFNLSFPKTGDVLSISVAKENYEDTTVVILSKERNTIVIYLQPKAPPVTIVVDDSLKAEVPVDTIDTSEPVVDSMNLFDKFWKRFNEERANLRNISDTLFTDVAVSFVPPLSTNHLLAVNTVNKYSFNILMGYSRGIDVMEIGGLVNVDAGNVKSFQLAGITNLVSGKVSGVQIGGISNLVSDTVEAFQLAGITNLNDSHFEGVQVAGIFNRSESVWGTQVAGIGNSAQTVTGGQIAGIANSANDVLGFQLSGIANRAGHITGSQIGLFNVSRSTTGVPVGFMSVVKTGYHKLELASDENLIGTMSFRTGVDQFHNIFIGGVQVSENPSLWTYGYGAGTALRLSKRFYFDADVTAQHLYLSGHNYSYNMLAKGFLGLEVRFGRKFAIAAGPTVNWYNTETVIGTDPIWNQVQQHTLVDEVTGNFSNKLWLGGKVAIRFF